MQPLPITTQTIIEPPAPMQWLDKLAANKPQLLAFDGYRLQPRDVIKP